LALIPANESNGRRKAVNKPNAKHSDTTMKRTLKYQSSRVLMLVAALAAIAQTGRLQGQITGRNIVSIAHDDRDACQGIGTVGVGTATFKLSSAKEVVMNLSGTMPLHDWTMSAHGLSGEAKMAVTTDNRLTGIQSLTFSLPVHNLKGEQTAMDNDAYKALKADQYQDIVFRLISATIEPVSGKHYNVLAKGTLTVAGVTREVVLKMDGNVAKDGPITFAGSEQVKMSDYNVERPSILFGVIKAGDVMTLTYNLVFIR
jgi:polyisoprenoid-binding protein YceI